MNFPLISHNSPNLDAYDNELLFTWWVHAPDAVPPTPPPPTFSLLSSERLNFGDGPGSERHAAGLLL